MPDVRTLLTNKSNGLIGAIAALLVGVQAVRVAAVEGFGGDAAANLLWPDHPRRVLDRGLTEIGTAAGRGQAPSAATLARINEVARRDPLAAQPFLVAGTAALASGQRTHAARLLSAAVRHDPRDPGARLLLASILLEDGKLEAGMLQVTALARLLPGGGRPLASSLAAFARQPGNAARIAPTLNQDADLRNSVLEELAADPANRDAILQVAGSLAPTGSGRSAPAWQGRLITALVNTGDYDSARRLWSRFAGKPASPATLTDPSFGDRDNLPPFGWKLTSGSQGSVEPDGQGGLQIQYYGRENVVLASQLATFAAGTYRLSMQASGGGEKAGDSLAWSVTCNGAKSPLATLALGGSGNRSLSTTFGVPEDCRAQGVALNGVSSEFPSTTSVQISGFRVERLPG